MECLETIDYRGYEIKVYQDESAENPITEWDGNVEFCCWHSRYDLGNSDRFGNESGEVEDCEAYAKETGSLLYPLFIYEHGGIALSLGREYPFDCQWDSGQLGYILIDREWMKEHFGNKYFTEKMKSRMRKAAENGVKLYNQYLSGAVYGYNIDDSVGDSCYGFYGYDHRESGLLEYAENAIDCYITSVKKDHFAKLKSWIKGGVPLQY